MSSPTGYISSGYIAVTPDCRVEASNHLKVDCNNRESYLRLGAHEIWTLEREELKPDPAALTWHNEN